MLATRTAFQGPRLARRRRKRRSVELRNSLRLGALLVALAGINVYVFFFNRGTAPRDVLNMQSTSKTLDSTRRELLARDQKAAQALVASAAPARPTSPVGVRPASSTIAVAH